MTLYLQNGWIMLPSMTINRIEVDCIMNPPSVGYGSLADARTSSSYYSEFNAGTLVGSFTTSGIVKGSRTTAILTTTSNVLYTSKTSIFANRTGAAIMPGRIYSIKTYNGATLVASYDMNTGTAQDISGNGYHATVTGGTWVDDGTGGVTTPTSLTLLLSDSITIGESFQEVKQGYLSLVDTVSLVETFTKRKQSYLTLNDGINLSDSETSTKTAINSLVKSLNDSITMTDTMNVRVMRYLTIFDLFTMVDSLNTTGGDGMSQMIKFKRGNEVDLPTLAEGEPAVALDTQKLFVGTPNGNTQIATLLVADSIDSLPNASKGKQFMICGVLGQTGEADALYVCKKLSDDTYDWVQFV